MAETRLPQGLTEEQARLLGGSFAEYTDYFTRFAARHFPQLNLVMIDSADPERDKRLFDGIVGILERPHVQARLTGELTYTDALPMMRDYATEIISDLNRSSQKNAAYLQETGSDAKYVGGYQPNFPRYELERLGAQVAPIIVDYGRCTSCKPQNDLLTCSHMSSASGLHDRMERVATGFHEMAHAVSLHGRTIPGLIIENYFGDKHYANRLESEANSFETLMMVREFGDLALSFTKLRQHAAGTDADHTTHRAMGATYDWIEQNRDKIGAMSPLKLFNVARQIGSEHALTKEEHKLADTFHRHYARSSEYEPDTVRARMQAGLKAAHGFSPAVSGYNDIGFEIDTMFLDHLEQLKTTVPRFEALASAAQSCAAPGPGLVDLTRLGGSLGEPEPQADAPAGPAGMVFLRKPPPGPVAPQ